MKKNAIVLAVLIVGAQAQAADAPAANPFYVTGAIGASHLDVNSNVSSDSKGKDGKVIFGQNFGYGVSMELGAVTLGKFGSVNVAAPTTTTKTTTTSTYKPTAVLLGLAYERPLAYGLGVKARLGLAQVKTKTASTAVTVVTPTTGTATTTTVLSNGTESKTRGYLGLGLTYAVYKDVQIELGIDSIASAVAGHGAARQITLGATYAFGANWGQEDEVPAQGQGFYVTAAGGTTSAKLSCPDGTTCDTSDKGLKLVGGYQFNHGLGLEAAYINFGKFNPTHSVTVGTTTTKVPSEAKPSALVLNGALAVPLTNDLGLKVRLGFAKVKTESATATASTSENKPKVYYGLAATYAINKNIKIEIAGDSTEADYLGGKAVTRLYSAGATYAF